jgi:protein tyrosine/serine phosphatase
MELFTDIGKYLRSWEPFSSLPHFGKVDQMLFRGGLPKEAGYRRLSELGIDTVINLIDENSRKQRDIASKYVNNWYPIPMSDTLAPSKDDIQEFVDIINRSVGRVFVHCKGGRHRTGFMVAVYRTVFWTWDKERAWKEAEDYCYYASFNHGKIREYFKEEFDPEDYKQGEVAGI